MLLTYISSNLATAKPFFLIYLVQSSQTSVLRHYPGITWNRARHQCKLYGLENRDDFLQKSVISNEREFWIGKAIYKKLTPQIEIIGI